MWSDLHIIASSLLVGFVFGPKIFWPEMFGPKIFVLTTLGQIFFIPIPCLTLFQFRGPKVFGRNVSFIAYLAKTDNGQKVIVPNVKQPI